jgi:two-component system, sensor histidine kinase PdtaS
VGLQKLRATQGWPLPIRLTTTGVAVATTCLFQLPLERQVPREPFLLFFVVVIASTMAFGAGVGFVSAGLTTLLSVLFFEPVGTLALLHAGDLIAVELYAILAGGSVVAFARLGNALIAARKNADSLNLLNESKSILLRELAHGVANNFASVAAFISLKSITISDVQAKSVLDEAIEQVRVMGQVHARLRAGHQDVSLDSQDFLQDLCDELAGSMARGRPISIECEADEHPLSADQAIALGLIINELVTNAIKHAFPEGRAGRIRVGFKALEDQLRLRVEDDGVGFAGRMPNGGMGQDVVKSLSRELRGELEVKTTIRGSSFRLSIPFKSAQPAALVH